MKWTSVYVARRNRLLLRILAGTSDQSIRFDSLISLLIELGFEQRVRGSHHILTHDRVEEILNLQPRPDGSAKPYQIKQVRNIIVGYRLTGDE